MYRILFFFLVSLLAVSCVSLDIPKVKIPFWDKLKPVELFLYHPDELACYKGTLVFESGGRTFFNQITEIDSIECFKSGIIMFSFEEFDDNMQWNFNYINERFLNCH